MGLESLYRVRFTYLESWAVGLDGGWQQMFLTASMIFRLIAGNTSPAAMAQALAELDTSGRDVTELVVGGPTKWPDPMLAEVASYLISTDKRIDDVSALLRLIEELDRRGSVPLARKLLKLIPADAVARPIPPADTATIVSLSRRHQLPELLSRCTSSDWLTHPVMEWLNIEDITWMIQSRSIPPESLERLRDRMKSDVRYRRAVSGAVEILAAELSITRRKRKPRRLLCCHSEPIRSS